MVDGLAQIRRGRLPHFLYYKRSDLSGRIVFALSLDPCISISVGDNFEGNVIKILLDLHVLELSSYQPVYTSGMREILTTV